MPLKVETIKVSPVNENDGKDINQIILNYISGFEGCHLKSYFDVSHYSIGYGTKSFKGETITQEEANKRAKEVIHNIRTKYNLSKLNIDKQKAIVDYIYNIGSLNSKQKWLLNNGYDKALANNFLLYTYADGKQLSGLIKRRQSEFNLLNK